MRHSIKPLFCRHWLRAVLLALACWAAARMPARAQSAPTPTRAQSAPAAAVSADPATSSSALFQPLPRQDLHDGYLVGNGRMFAVGALGRELTREGKSSLGPNPAPLTELAWVAGPSYGNANLGFGWEVLARVDGRPALWTSERVVRPTAQHPFWGVESHSGALDCQLTDVLAPDAPVLLRRLVITRPPGLPAAVQLRLPVRADPRNGRFFHVWGNPVAPSEPIWAPSVPADQLRRVDRAAGALVLTGARRRLYEESSTPYKMDFPARVLATAASEGKGVKAGVDAEGLSVDLGLMKGGERRAVAVWIVTAPTREGALASLQAWRKKDPEDLLKASLRQQPKPLLSRTDGRPDPLLEVIGACQGLAEAAQARCGGVLAQAYMYPMCYIRDQYGSFRLFLDSGDAERAYREFAYCVAMQNQYGIQNANDAVPDPPDPARFDPAAGRLDSFNNIAEVPSIVILMARDFYQATGDLGRIAPLYPRLAYNLRVQRPDRNGLLPTVGDESYTNVAAPRFSAEMTDSNLLFLAAAEFMTRLADKLGKSSDAAEFRQRAERVRAALMRRLWLPEARAFAFARDDSDDPAKIDPRPAFDLLLRWFWLELGDPCGPVPQGCLAAVLGALCHPIEVVPRGGICAGMDPGYLLYALARSQHPATHSAARLLLGYGSDAGLFDEYYLYPDGRIAPDPGGGTLRPWESAVNGWALMHYLLGLRVGLPEGRLTLQPHLPPGWPGWVSKEIDLGGEGSVQARLERSAGGRVTFSLKRRGGVHPLKVDVEFGAFGPRLTPAQGGLEPVAGHPDRLRAEVLLPPAHGLLQGVTKIRLVFSSATCR